MLEFKLNVISHCKYFNYQIHVILDLPLLSNEVRDFSLLFQLLVRGKVSNEIEISKYLNKVKFERRKK
jgi:hypothetical protein